MAIIGIGTDIVKISRIKRIFNKYPKGFAERILHRNELKVLKGHKSPKTYIAKRFSAKEAVAKALGTGISEGVAFQEIEISNDDKGQPQLTLHGKTLEIAQSLGVKKHFISLSDEQKYAIAYVILEGV
ncbi:MAG: holo-ACP synthase [Cocleimonas sp.]